MKTDRASRRNAILRPRDADGKRLKPMMWPSAATAIGPAPCDWTPYAQTRGRGPKPRLPWRSYTGAELRAIRAREFNYLGEVQR